MKQKIVSYLSMLCGILLSIVMISISFVLIVPLLVIGAGIAAYKIHQIRNVYQFDSENAATSSRVLEGEYEKVKD
ncbi:hypothetical protein ST37_01010 (plasmid) [Vibrio sp. qd031]|uniref:hypothetical protein n=1 Tax=Vibrio sp. qd031 TaxID=1603038 RepID=UPI000A11CED1|nr:hypothetical protein [Vibrio sp. qd031]ORT52405.1 hypothetical protein ST37_01010 [Vibrio sp. qd031]